MLWVISLRILGGYMNDVYCESSTDNNANWTLNYVQTLDGSMFETIPHYEDLIGIADAIWAIRLGYVDK